ncbi:hypothetical protein [Actinoplanes lobatus]|nr:hypothetical protein [Actinoplanes lobatus]
MGTVEVRNPFHDPKWSWSEPWTPCMNVSLLVRWPLYCAYGCLFGVRNYQDWKPIAPQRGLPEDVSQQVRNDFDEAAAIDGAVGGETWVGWDELKDLDMSVTAPVSGVLIQTWSDGCGTEWTVHDTWPEKVGRSPLGPSPVGAPFGKWQVGEVTYEFKKLDRRHVLGPGTGWDKAFDVLRALAAIHGDDGVRLVVGFVG